MAKKKKENGLSYLQVPLPSGGKYSKMTKVAFGGLNKRYTLDSGNLSMESNISTNEYPYLTPSPAKQKIEDLNEYDTPISISAFDNFFVVVYYENKKIMVDYVVYDEDANKNIVYTGILQPDENKAKATMDMPRSIVQFNVYDTPTDPLAGRFIKKLLFFPDKASMFMKIMKSESNPSKWTTEEKDAALTDVMYCYDNGTNKYYYIVNVIAEEDDDGNVTYSREVKRNGSANEFSCDGMEALVKEYSNTNKETDESGAEIYPPPETASHNFYYKNVANIEGTNFGTDIYAWREYETEDGGTAYGWKVVVPPAIPNIKYATVHLSRVFGVDDDRVYASGYNNYANWNLDTIDEFNEANSWCSPSQSNTKAGGIFTGITAFQNHVICFKRDFMHEIYNTKNPFRLQDIYAEGAIDNRTIQDVDGRLIFVSEDDVKVYTGSNPRIIGYNLNMPRYKYAVSGTDNRNYYLYCEENSKNKHLYVYDTFTDLWSERSIDYKVWGFAHNKNGMYMLCADGCVYKMDTNSHKHDWSFETDLITSKTVNIKHIKKLQMLVEVDEDDEAAYMQVYILYDHEEFDGLTDDEKSKRLAYSSTRKGKFPIRVKPRNTANYGFKLHVEGKGYVKLYELEIFIEAGGDLYV